MTVADRAAPASDRRVVVVTGGGGGIGGAIAEELGRNGDVVVTMDPLVTLDGTEQLAVVEETTADRIVAAGGAATASSVSVTDADGVRSLFDELVAEHGRLDAVINVAGITRPTSYATGTEDDWSGVLAVHLDGYLNILRAALPIMAAAGHGRILGVTSGSGWRAADAGAYGCAKRAVASLTWQLGAQPPPGVVVNAMSPIAVTRMVTAALGRAPKASSTGAGGSIAGSGSSATGGLSLGSMPEPDQLGPLGAYLVGDDLSWCSGQVIFAGGPETAVIDPPRLLEVVRTGGAASLAAALDTFTTQALAKAQERQLSTGGGNPRFPPVFTDVDGTDRQPAAASSCVVVSDRPELVASVAGALGARGVASTGVAVEGGAVSFAGADRALESTVARAGPVDAVVVALAGRPPAMASTTPWEQIVDDHDGIADGIRVDAAWVRAVADHTSRTGRPIRLVVLTDATTAGGRSRAQASAQLGRAARKATDGRVVAFAVAVEAPADQTDVGEVTAHLVADVASDALAGAELAVGSGWFGVRSHPRPGGSIVFGGPEVPPWLDGTLRAIVDPNARPVR